MDRIVATKVCVLLRNQT